MTADKAVALRGRNVKILYDKDEAGRKGAQSARSVLLDAGVSVGVVDVDSMFAGRPEGWDIADEIVAERHGLAEVTS